MKKFIIDHIDPLGQGVFKKDDEIYFIPKTLPSETGTFEITKSRKGVNFGKILSLESKSPKRIKPECIHFDVCSGCHFLHTSYSEELNYKLASFQKLLNQLNCEIPEIQLISSEHRLGYRNRIQLHYNLKIQKIGFKAARSNQIIEIPECLIMEAPVKAAYIELLSNWKKIAFKKKHKQGHIEIYHRDGEVEISWNKPYAEGGFSQVNTAVNIKMKHFLDGLITKENASILDLFGGEGNLTKNLKANKIQCIDLYSDEKRNSDFFHLNLFEQEALETFQNSTDHNFDTFIIDPPRSGFKFINSWVNSYKPSEICYISCHPATMIRDLKLIQAKYQIESVSLIDLFPSTFHYEALIYMKKL